MPLLEVGAKLLESPGLRLGGLWVARGVEEVEGLGFRVEG